LTAAVGATLDVLVTPTSYSVKLESKGVDLLDHVLDLHIVSHLSSNVGVVLRSRILDALLVIHILFVIRLFLVDILVVLRLLLVDLKVVVVVEVLPSHFRRDNTLGIIVVDIVSFVVVV
jgi:hypothetical protein